MSVAIPRECLLTTKRETPERVPVLTFGSGHKFQAMKILK